MQTFTGKITFVNSLVMKGNSIIYFELDGMLPRIGKNNLRFVTNMDWFSASGPDLAFAMSPSSAHMVAVVTCACDKGCECYVHFARGVRLKEPEPEPCMDPEED